MNKGFPNYEQQGWWIFKFKAPSGWADLGPVESVNGQYKIHLLCGERLNVGKENGNIFLFCPRCLVKFKN